MDKLCLYCYEPLNEPGSSDFHERCSMAFFGTSPAPRLEYSLDQMAELAKNVVEQSIAVPGVQPKLSLTIIHDALGKEPANRLTVVGALGGNYILKPPSAYYKEMPQNEHVTMRIAQAFELQTVPSSLIRLASGELAYITKRIDRTASGQKIHMLDMFQILEAFDKYKSSMEKVGKGIGAYSSNTLLDQLYYFELAVFSFLTGNNDMHLKNFSLIANGNDWELSPAYDLLNVIILNPGDDEELALTLEGKKKKLQRPHYERFGKALGLNERQVTGAFNRMINNKPTALQWIDRSFLSKEHKNLYKAVLEERYARIAL
jgi:serine/threonine-protein kinase HipA